MDKLLVYKSEITPIADSIRNKTGTTALLKLADMPGLIEGISGGTTPAEPQLEDILIDENGTYYPSEGHDGFYEVQVNVETPEPILENTTITTNGKYTPSIGYDGFYEIDVKVPGGSQPPIIANTSINSNSYKMPQGHVNVEENYPEDCVVDD